MPDWNIYLPLIGILLLLLCPREGQKLPHWIALGTLGTGLIMTVFYGIHLIAHRAAGVSPAEMHLLADVSWIPSLGIQYRLGIDGVSWVLLLLTGILSLAGILFSWNIVYRVRDFYLCYLLLIGSIYGVFLSLDLFLWSLFFGLTLLPLYLLIGIWGFVEKEAGALKLSIALGLSGALGLLPLLAVVAQTGGSSFDLLQLSALPKTRAFQLWAFPVSCLGFGVLAGLWPLHSWAQPVMKCTPASINILLVGLMMPLGVYGIYRISIPLFPEGFVTWKGTFTLLALVGIISCSLSALVQRDIKSIATSASISLISFATLGVMIPNPAAQTGALLQLFSQGILVGLLWGIVGRMICDRTHATEPDALSVFKLPKTLPFALGAFTLCAVALSATPLFSGSVAELHILVGLWASSPPLALIAGVGVILTVVYLSRAIHLVFFTQSRIQKDSETKKIPRFFPPQALTLPEKLGTLFLLSISLLVGIFPQVLLNFITPCIQERFSGLLNL